MHEGDGQTLVGQRREGRFDGFLARLPVPGAGRLMAVWRPETADDGNDLRGSEGTHGGNPPLAPRVSNCRCSASEYAVSRDRTFTGVALRWGLGPSTEEGRVFASSRRPAVLGFNGASVFQPRKAIGATSRTAPRPELQWGLGLSTEEGMRWRQFDGQSDCLRFSVDRVAVARLGGLGQSRLETLEPIHTVCT